MTDDRHAGWRWSAITLLTLIPLRLVLRFTNLATAQRFASVIARIGAVFSPRLSPAQIGTVVTAMADRLPGTTCLKSSITATALLDANGYESELKIGVFKSRDDFQAHAWVESRGQPVVGDDGNLTSYQILTAPTDTNELLFHEHSISDSDSDDSHGDRISR